jgi:hypothetical protein
VSSPRQRRLWQMGRWWLLRGRVASAESPRYGPGGWVCYGRCGRVGGCQGVGGLRRRGGSGTRAVVGCVAGAAWARTPLGNVRHFPGARLTYWKSASCSALSPQVYAATQDTVRWHMFTVDRVPCVASSPPPSMLYFTIDDGLCLLAACAQRVLVYGTIELCGSVRLSH